MSERPPQMIVEEKGGVLDAEVDQFLDKEFDGLTTVPLDGAAETDDKSVVVTPSETFNADAMAAAAAKILALNKEDSTKSEDLKRSPPRCIADAPKIPQYTGDGNEFNRAAGIVSNARQITGNTAVELDDKKRAKQERKSILSKLSTRDVVIGSVAVAVIASLSALVHSTNHNPKKPISDSATADSTQSSASAIQPPAAPSTTSTITPTPTVTQGITITTAPSASDATTTTIPTTEPTSSASTALTASITAAPSTSVSATTPIPSETPTASSKPFGKKTQPSKCDLKKNPRCNDIYLEP